jgi:ParB/RepB/Spo0J family partition protein
MKLENIPISEVDFDNETFFIGSKGDISSLKKSIKEVGIINPPILIERKGKYQIMCGRRRLEACKGLGFIEVLSKIYQGGEVSNEECLKLIFYDNRERLSDMEKAEFLLKFKELCDFNESELLQKALPLLGIAPSRKNFENYMKLVNLEREIKDAFYLQRITIEQVFMLGEADSSTRIEILERVLLKFKFNTNETREVVREIQEVGFRDRKSISDVVDEIGLKIGEKGVKADFRRELRTMRYPALLRAEEEFRDCLRSLNLPNEVNISHSPFFEGNYVEIRIRIEGAEELREILSYLHSALNKGEIDRLLDIAKEGKVIIYSS